MGFENREIIGGNLQIFAIVLLGIFLIPVLWFIGVSKRIKKNREMNLNQKLFIEMFRRNTPKKTSGNQIPARRQGERHFT